MTTSHNSGTVIPMFQGSSLAINVLLTFNKQEFIQIDSILIASKQSSSRWEYNIFR